jgi:signal transduction histidine kinase
MVPQDSRTPGFEADLDAIAGIEAVPVILDVICRTTGMGFAAIARVTDTRWITCAVRDDVGLGLAPGSELKVETTICQQVRGSSEAVVINHVAEDPVFRDHLTPAMYGFQSYVSMPIRLPDGSFFGTLCAIDPSPRPLDSPTVVSMFRMFADLIGQQLDTHRRLRDATADLTQARRDSELREQFIAVLGHDLRNPLASIAAAGRAVLRTPVSEEAQLYVGLIHNSVTRMSGLIDNVMDFARGRLGAGLPLERQAGAALAPLLRLVVDELRSAHPEREIVAELPPLPPLHCDPDRIAQLLSNLLANALLHGAPDAPVQVRTAVDGVFELSVTNEGEPIPVAVQQELFQPFFRANVRRRQQGLGLGLYIAAEIARAHGGRLAVESGPAGTRFTFTMPLDEPLLQASSASSSKLSG